MESPTSNNSYCPTEYPAATSCRKLGSVGAATLLLERAAHYVSSIDTAFALPKNPLVDVEDHQYRVQLPDVRSVAAAGAGLSASLLVGLAMSFAAEARASAAAPDDVPSAAAAAEEVNDDPMEVEEEVMPGQVEDGAGADRELSAGLENEDDEGNEAEADDEATSPGGKHERDDEEEDEEDDDSDEEWQDEKKTYDSSGGQRRSKRDKGESERKRPPPPSSPEEYADVARGWYNQQGGAFTSKSTRRPPANSSQHA
ncbi:hypothetical protein THAOC_24142, partial [Thalassiosira oceanica]